MSSSKFISLFTTIVILTIASYGQSEKVGHQVNGGDLTPVKIKSSQEVKSKTPISIQTGEQVKSEMVNQHVYPLTVEYKNSAANSDVKPERQSVRNIEMINRDIKNVEAKLKHVQQNKNLEKEEMYDKWIADAENRLQELEQEKLQLIESNK